MRMILAACFAAVSASGGIASGQQLHLTPETCHASIKSIGNCPEDGCGGTSDALLNQAKNRTDSPTGTPEILHVHEIVDIEEPDDWLTGQDRDSLSGDEGREVQLMAFLKIVK